MRDRTGRGGTPVMMKRRFTGDVWTDAKLLQAEELAARARAAAACRALLRDSYPPRRSLRMRLGAILLAAGQWLLAPFADPAPGAQPGSAAGGTVSHRNRRDCPLCRSPVLDASPSRRTR